MAITTFNPQDEAAEAARVEAEKRALQIGEEVLAKQDQAAQDKFAEDQKALESETNYAGKYKSAEDLEKAYLELQKKLGERTEDSEEKPAAEEQQEDSEEAETDQEPNEAYQTLEAASKEYEEGGELSEDTLEKLSQLDSKELIENWVEYVNSSKPEQPEGAIPQEDVDRIMGSVGGNDQYQTMVSWASDALAPDEIAAYDAVVSSGNPDAIYWAVQGLRSKYVESNGYEGKQVSGVRAPRPEPGFRSQAELARAIGDSRYQDDPAYRLDVQQKLERSGDLM
tara:strand:- start:696 stop:1541 length:846 start_codon:yes stop_codon:yes gene_type:complete